MCSGPIKFLTKTLWLSGHNPLCESAFCSQLKSLPAPSQETGGEAAAAAHTEGGLISLIDLHGGGFAVGARVRLRLCVDLMPDINPQNQLANTNVKIVSPFHVCVYMCVCVRVRGTLSVVFRLLIYLFTPSLLSSSACLTPSISFFLLRQLALCWSRHVLLLNPRGSPVKF